MSETPSQDEAKQESGRLRTQRAILSSEFHWFGGITRHVAGVGLVRADDGALVGADEGTGDSVDSGLQESNRYISFQAHPDGTHTIEFVERRNDEDV